MCHVCICRITGSRFIRSFVRSFIHSGRQAGRQRQGIFLLVTTQDSMACRHVRTCAYLLQRTCRIHRREHVTSAGVDKQEVARVRTVHGGNVRITHHDPGGLSLGHGFTYHEEHALCADRLLV